MDNAIFGRVRDRLVSGVGHDTIYRILETAATVAYARSAALIEWSENKAEIILAYGMSPFADSVMVAKDHLFQALTSDHHESISKFGYSAINVPLKRYDNRQRLTIACWGMAENQMPSEYVIEVITRLASAINQQINVMSDVLDTHFIGAPQQKRVAEQTMPYTADGNSVAETEGSTVVTEFLLRTLVNKRRLLTRDDVTYHSIRSWRASIKDSQIAALRAAKQAPSPSLAKAAADELATEAKRVVGSEVIRSVAAVPCGHSGPQCLARQIAIEAAAALGVRHVDLFEYIPLNGVSHPKTNTKRPPMRMIEKLEGPVLLVDDVATSGSHIIEAVKQIRASGSVVVPIVWISAIAK